jgi:hypothetical protein
MQAMGLLAYLCKEVFVVWTHLLSPPLDLRLLSSSPCNYKPKELLDFCNLVLITSKL